jgi:hypothetical protein
MGERHRTGRTARWLGSRGAVNAEVVGSYPIRSVTLSLGTTDGALLADFVHRFVGNEGLDSVNSVLSAAQRGDQNQSRTVGPRIACQRHACRTDWGQSSGPLQFQESVPLIVLGHTAGSNPSSGR